MKRVIERVVLSIVFSIAVFLISALAHPTRAHADDGLLETFGADRITADKVGDGGLGFSALANVTRFYADGRYEVLAAGVGFGISWKRPETSNHPLELGLYVAPQIAGGTDEEDAARVSVLLHATFFKKLGIGVGFDAWFSDGGLSPDGVDTSSRVFFTLGYGLTNETEPE